MVTIEGYFYYTEKELIELGFHYSHTTLATNSRVFVNKDNSLCAMFFSGSGVAPIMENISFKND